MGHYGLNPTLRGLKGVGFGRALPAPFGFDLAVIGDGVNDYFSLPRWVGQAWPTNWTIEYWVKLTATPNNIETGMVRMNGGDGSVNVIELSSHTTTPVIRIRNTGTGASTVLSGGSLPLGGTYHIVTRSTGGNYDVAINGIGLAGSLRLTATNANVFKAGVIINAFTLLQPSFGQYFPHKFDEFRFYNRAISDAEVMGNYNNGIGENPHDVVGLMTWYRFSKFETLDFSATQDNSDLRIGMRDNSDNFNHAQPFSLITTPGTGYVLQPF